MSSPEMRQAVAAVENLPEQITGAIADVENKAVTEVKPLYYSIDPDALGTLFQGRQTTGKVVFHHAECEITVYSDGRIDVSPPSP